MDGWKPSSGHPPLPPTSEDELIWRLRLLRSRRVGPATFHRLLKDYGSARAAVGALPQIARDRGLKSYAPCSWDQAEGEYRAGLALGAQLIPHDHPDFPSPLAVVSDAPPVIWTLGHVEILQKPCVAIVGARNASSNGTRMARKLAYDLAQAGVTVVSGLARGVDTATHIGSLEQGTAAVLAGGVDRVYPEENAQLGRQILSAGVRISEQPIGLQAQARHFPRRNRIISGLSKAVVVVEAAAKSGTLITAKQALDQGRDVLAVPGHPVDGRAAGCNMLIRDGATLVRTAQDVLDILQNTAVPIPLPTPVQKPTKVAEDATPFTHQPLRKIAALHQKILSRLGPAPTLEDQLGRDLKLPASDLSSALIELEIQGEVERQSGGMIVKIPRN